MTVEPTGPTRSGNRGVSPRRWGVWHGVGTKDPQECAQAEAPGTIGRRLLPSIRSITRD